MKYIKKPIVIEAFKWTFDEVPKWWTEAKGIHIEVISCTALIPTLEGIVSAKPGDYIIQGIKGEIYPCKPDIFEMTYDPVNSIQQREHLESQHCWCGPTLIQAIDDEHDCEVWSHKGNEELNQ